MMPSTGFRAGTGLNNPIIIDEDNDSDNNSTISPDEFDDDDIASQIALFTDIDFNWPAAPRVSINRRTLLSHEFSGLTLRPEMIVELTNGDFLRITSIPQHSDTGEVLLEGQVFRRTRYLDGLLERKKNEVVWIQRYDPNIDGDIFRQSLQCISLNEVVQKRELVLTNQLYPAESYREELIDRCLTVAEILENCRLVCRWKFLSNGDKEGCLMASREDEVDTWFRSPCSALESTFRGVSIRGGSCPYWLAGEKAFDNAERARCNNLDPLRLRQPYDNLQGSGHRYTFGDGICGAGGVSRGAKAAGLRVLWGFDFNKAAIESYQSNFYETMCWCCDAHTFLVSIPDDFKVDVLHISPPCQTFSPAHVRPGQNDDANEASFFVVEEVLKKVKPRVVMVEETFGLLRTAYRKEWFKAMIQTFTKLGFSVRWKVFNLLDFGLPGRRERLFVFASW